MGKIDYKKELKHLYRPSAKAPGAVDVPRMNFLMIDGQGDPGTSQAFQDAIGALYPVAYTLKFTVKKGDIGIDYGVLPLEGLWWTDDMSTFSVEDKANWKWTLMIMQPEFISQAMVLEAVAQVRTKKNPASLPLLRFSPLDEGTSAQIMHIGPFSDEGPAVDKVHSLIAERGSERRGKHHEIYLSDFRRVAPEKMKTIIRQPMS